MSSIGCLVAEKSLCGLAQAEIWWVAQQNRVTPSPFNFGLSTFDLDLDLDCDNLQSLQTAGWWHLQSWKKRVLIIEQSEITNQL